MVEAARLGQLSTVRKLLDSGTANVEDRDEVSVCATKQQYMALIVYHFLIIPHAPRAFACCVHACVSAPLLLK